MDQSIFKTIRKWFGTLPGEQPRLYLVGGAVRDWLLEKEIKDIDIVCHDAKNFSETLAKEKKLTLVAFEKIADEPCYRLLGRDIMKGITIDISQMRGNTINEDLKCRDFSMNAMAMEIIPEHFPSTIIDPLGGQNDLKQRLIRLCSDHAIIDDPLRMLRAFRFSAELGYTIEKNSEISISQQTFRLRQTAPERVISEMLRIFAVINCYPYIWKMDQLGLLEVIFPEIQPMKACPQNAYHHQDVWNHSLSVLQWCEIILNHPETYFKDSTGFVLDCIEKYDRIPILKMAALFHDIGKPDTRSMNKESGKITFYGHDAMGKNILSGIAIRLKMPKKSRIFMEMLAAEHLHVTDLSKSGVKKSTIINFFKKLGDDAIFSIILSMADTQSKMGPSTLESEKQRYLDWCGIIIAEYFGSIRQLLERKSLINGKDLIRMGLLPGREMGKILKRTREAQDSGKLKGREEALDFVKSIIEHD